jgi:lipopolysaccharide assembly outer membrane protein LptD (OstA)
MKKPYQIQPKTIRKSRIQNLLFQFWISGLCLIASTLCVLIPGTAPGQAKNPPPSLPSPPAKSPQDLDFSADHVVDQVSENRIVLTGNVVLKFQDVEIRAGKVVFDRSSGTITAEALTELDDPSNEVGRPYFTRGTEKFSGSRMVYDIASKKGRVWDGRVISQERYHIRGEHALLDSLENVFLESLTISTCDADHEHYRFQVGRLKVIENDKAIARNVTFELGPVPLMWIPFYVFPLQKGRRSGVLTPDIGTNSRDGFSVSNLGYYYAPNDYWDATLAATLREQGGLLLDGDLAYNVLNRARGSAQLQFENFNTSTGTSTRNWRLNFNHWQRLSSSSSVRATGNFTSSRTFDERNTNTLYNFLNQQLRSSLSFDKNWREAGRSVDVGLTYVRDLEDKTNAYRGFPRVSFRQSRRRVFGSGSAGSTSRSASTAGQPWYRAFYYSFSGDLDNAFTQDPVDSLETDDLTVGGRLTVNSQHRPMGWLELTPALTTAQRVSRNNQNRATRTESYSASINAGTTIYGIFLTEVGRLRGIRHRFQPRAGFRYTQSASVDGGTLGFGGARTAGNARRNLDLSVSNTFEVKTENEDGKQNRFTFASANVTTGLDFDSGPQRWRDLRSTVSVKPDRRFDIRMNTNHTLYDEDDQWKPLQPRLENLTVTSNFRFSGSGRDARSPGNQQNIDIADPLRPPSDFGFERNLYGETSTGGSPWRFSIGHHFDMRRTLTGTRRTSWIKTDFGFNPRRFVTRVDYAINVNLVDPDVTNQTISIYRELHCFESRLTIVPNGFNRGFAFKINIKDIPQIGVSTRRGGVYGL